MTAYNIRTFEDAQNLVKLCDKYNKELTIDVIHGRYMVDGCSVLGVMSLVGNIVTVEAEGEKKDEFYAELKNMSDM